MTLLIQIFAEFFKIGLFSIGGGLATLPFLYELSAARQWFTTADVANMIAISESTPGPLGVNMATFVGYTTSRLPGSIIATLGLVAPSIIIIILIAKILDRFKNSIIVKRIFHLLRPASTGLIAAAGLGIARVTLLNTDLPLGIGSLNLPAIFMAAVLFFTIKKYKKHPIFYIGASAVVGVLWSLV